MGFSHLLNPVGRILEVMEEGRVLLGPKTGKKNRMEQGSKRSPFSGV